MRWTKQHGSAKAYKGFKWWTQNCKLAIASSLPHYLLHSLTIPYHTIPYILPEDTQDRLPYFPHPRTSRMPVGQSCCCWPCFLHGAWLTDVYSAFSLPPNTYPRQNNLLLSSVTLFAMWSLCRIHRIVRGRFGAPCFFSTCTRSPRFTSCFYPQKHPWRGRESSSSRQSERSQRRGRVGWKERTRTLIMQEMSLRGPQ